MKTLNLILILLLIIISSCEPQKQNNNNNSNNNNSNKGNKTDIKLSYKGKKLILTKHAKCRMDCRYIDESEIMEIIANNNINARKSTKEVSAGKCPTTAYEGVSGDEQQLRIIIAYCEGDEVAKVVTVIDTGNEFSCTCD